MSSANGDAAATFRAIFRIGGAGFAELDAASGRHLRVNRRYCEMLGRDEATLLALPPWEVVHPDDAAAFRAACRPEASPTLPSSGAELRFLRPDGEERWVEVRIAVSARDDQGAPSRLVAMALDVTESRRTAERLQAREALLRLCLRTGHIGTYSRDIAAGRIDADAEARAMHGLPPGEEPLPQEVWLDTLLPEDREVLRRQIAGALAARHTEGSYQYRLLRTGGDAGGGLRHIEARVTYEYDASGEPRRAIGVLIDVTEHRAAEEKLRESEAQLQLSLAIGNIGTYRRDHRTRFFECGPETRALHGLPPGDAPVPDRLWLDLLLPEDRRRLREEAEAAIGRRQPEIAYEYRFRHPVDGKLRHIEARARYEYDAEGRPLRTAGVVIDVTAGRSSAELLRLCLEVGRIGDFRHDFRTGLVTAGRKTRELYGLPPDEAPIPVARWFAALLPEDRERLLARIRAHLARQDVECAIDYRIRHRGDGRLRHLEARARYEYDAEGRPLSAMGVVIDVTERREAEERLAHLARHDPLTGLPNRLMFREGLDAALAQARRGDGFALHCLDLDRFKEVNDTLGHPVGDALLREVAERVRAELREMDTLARLGGDEFAVIQRGAAGAEPAASLAGRIVAALSRPFDLDGHRVTIGTSVGIALAPGDALEADALMRDADMALYRAKAEGRGRWSFFEPEMDARLQLRRALELELRRALAGEEFELFYQPIVELRSRRPVGFEALMRWRHPERGVVTPDSFISLCEDIGLIVALGEWALLRACRDAVGWPGAPRVAVNLSPAQFAFRGLVDAVDRALRSSGLEPSRLELEVTETVMLSDSGAALATLRQLKELGVRIALDDFGTGYSSLSHLQRFPVDKVKIDRCFIGELGLSSRSRAIVQAVTRLCDGLAMTTTAEGVETWSQLEAVRLIGCVEAQGYLFSRPVPAAQVPALLSRRWRPAGPEAAAPAGGPLDSAAAVA
jgi:diguanylate cyclase (GGDEF)-like protein/PAS domain S-box-containing protein